MQRPELRILNITLVLIAVMLSKLTPYLTLLLPCYLGFMLVKDVKGLDGISRLSISPAVGLAITIFLMHILSWLGLSLSLAYPILAVLTVTISLLVPPIKLKQNAPGYATGGVVISLFLSFIIKIPFFRVPAYPGAVGRDAVFHAYKSLEILKENTIFIKSAPLGFTGIITYPAGYHSIVAFLSGTTGITVAESMLILKILTWIFIPLGTYAAAWSIFKNARIAVFSAILAPISYLYYYYLNYSLLHQFLDYYMFLVAVSLYNVTLEKPERKGVLLSLLVISAVLLIHPYVYLAFEAYTAFAVLMIFLKQKKIETRAFGVFLLQITGSFLIYYLLEYPMRLHIIQYTAFFGSPEYAFKDNILWVLGILQHTFLSEWQVILGIFFVAGVLYSVKNDNPFLRALTITLFCLIFLVFNKIMFHIPIPFYSGIWSSERIYVLITPMIPIIGGTGLYVIHRYMRKHFTHPKILAVSLALLLMLPAFYVNLWNFSFEAAGCINSSSVAAFEFMKDIDAKEILVPEFYDSGIWVKIYLPEKNVVLIKNSTEIPDYREGILYVDSRGYGDFRINPLNPWDIAQKYRVLYFRDNIWIFNLSDNATSYLATLYRYFAINKDEIQASDMHDWRYLSYGFLLRHPAIIHGIKFEKWNIIIVRSRKAVIAVVPARDYTGIGIELYLKANQTINILINGKLVGKIRSNGYWKFEYPLKKNSLYIIELEGEPGYAFVRMKLEGGR